MRPTELVITNPQWMPKEKTSGGVRNDPAHVRINPTSISIKSDAWKWMGSPERIELGTAEYKGEVILTMRPGDRGHKLVNPPKGKRKVFNGAGLMKRLKNRGLQPGAYELVKHSKKDIYFALPV